MNVELEIDLLQSQINDIKNLLDKFENWKQLIIKEKIEDLMRLRKLESKFNELKDSFEKHAMEYGIYRNKYFMAALTHPYKCPVCEGRCTPNDENLKGFLCGPCEGTGLVWR